MATSFGFGIGPDNDGLTTLPEDLTYDDFFKALSNIDPSTVAAANKFLSTEDLITGRGTDVQQMLQNIYSTPGSQEVIAPYFEEFSRQNPELAAQLQPYFEKLVDPNTPRTVFDTKSFSMPTTENNTVSFLNSGVTMSDLDHFSGNSSFSTSGPNTGGFDLVGAITNAFSPSSNSSSSWSGTNFIQAPTLGFGLGGNEGYSGTEISGRSSFGAGLFPNTEIIDVGGAKVAGDSITVKGLRDFASVNSPEEVALVVGGLLAAGLLISSLGGSGPPSGSVEVTGKKPVEPPPAEPPPAKPPPAEPPPVIPPPAETSPNPTEEVPKQEPTAEEKSLAEKLGIPAATLATLLKYGLGALASYLSYKSAKDAQEQAKGASFTSRGPVTSTRRAYQGSTYKPAAQGGLMALAGGGEISQPFYLGGPTDGMADEVPAHIDNKRPAALSDGEFVIPADVVSHLGNGNSNAGASRLYEMMDRVREARTGNRKQGIQINPNKFMPR